MARTNMAPFKTLAMLLYKHFVKILNPCLNQDATWCNSMHGADRLVFEGLENSGKKIQQQPKARTKVLLDKHFIVHRFSTGKQYLLCLSVWKNGHEMATPPPPPFPEKKVKRSALKLKPAAFYLLLVCLPTCMDLQLTCIDLHWG